MEFLKEYIRFMLSRRKYWLIPVLVLLVLIGALLLLAQGSVVAPFVYTLF